MQISPSRLSSQRGAVLIHVAIALLGLVAFTTFVTDYGIMWVSRGQAQTAADAGALSGALSLAFDDATDFAGAKEKARAVAIANAVFGQAPDVQLTDVTFPSPCPPGAPGLADTCVKVDAFRNLARGNPLPMFFGRIVGVSNQGVVATATAQVVTGRLSECLRPWAVMDRWDEFDESTNGTESEFLKGLQDPDYNYYDSTFDKYSNGKKTPQENDLYQRPDKANGTAGTGFRLPDDIGRRYIVKTDSNTNSTVSPGWFRAIRIPRLDGQNGGNVYRDNITSCGGLPTGYALPETVCPTDINNGNQAYWAERGCYGTEPGNMVGPTVQGVEDLIALDKDAKWVGNAIIDSTFPEHASPRIVPIGVIDIDHFLSQDPSGANGVLRLVNIFGFFIEGMGDIKPDGTPEIKTGGKAVIGRIVTVPSMEGTSTLPNNSSFLRKVILVR